MSHRVLPPRSRRPSIPREARRALVVVGVAVGAAIAWTNRPGSRHVPLAPCEDAASPREADAAPSTMWLAADPTARGAAFARTLRHGSADARIEVVRALGAPGPSSPERELLVGALDDEDPEVRREARLALRRAGLASRDVVASLCRRAAGDDDLEAADALRTLGAVAGDRSAVLETLVEATAAGSGPRARGGAAGLVLAGEAGLARLRAALDRDADALDALRGVTVRAIGDAETTRLATTLTALLDDSRRTLRVLAMRSLASAAPNAASAASSAPALAARLAAQGTDDEERRLAVEALGALAPAAPSASDALRAALQGADAGVRAAASREDGAAR